MHAFDVSTAPHGFEVLTQTPRTQAATMTLSPKERQGGPDNVHHADQWLFVVHGDGELVVEGNHLPLWEGKLVLIEAGEHHEVVAGPTGLTTINVYGPPEY